jgi:hypothetical protein
MNKRCYVHVYVLILDVILSDENKRFSIVPEHHVFTEQFKLCKFNSRCMTMDMGGPGRA